MSRRSPYKKPDHFTVEAKKAGYPARSVFKLEEIDQRVKLLRPGMRVLDLGAAPGSWALYASQRIGPKGKLLAIDRNPLTVGLPTHAQFSQGDALLLTNETLSVFAPYDVVLSDMAPNTSGNRSADQARSFELFMRALEVAARLTQVGGSFVGKIFMGEDLPLARTELRKHFGSEKLIRPEGTRSVSYELFLVGLGRRGEGSVTPAATPRGRPDDENA
jgi:23S rRNA (uridine2552-2'-O)-methyltransferase